MDTRDAAADRKKSDGRGPFEKFVEAVNQQVSRAPFFVICLAIIIGWLVSYPLFSSGKNWQYVIHTISSVISLLLLVLLENAGRRSQESVHEKLNVIAEGLIALMRAVTTPSSRTPSASCLRPSAWRSATDLHGGHRTTSYLVCTAYVDG